MATFQAQVEGLLGFTTTDHGVTTTELSFFLRDGVLDVTNKTILVRPQDAILFQRESAETAVNNNLAVKGPIISVVREDGTNNQWRKCNEIPSHLQYDVTDPESLNYASKVNPVYTLLGGGKISVFPAPGADPNTFKVYYVNNDAVANDNGVLVHSDEEIGYFPKEKAYLVVIYAAMQTLNAAIGKNVISLDVSLPTISATAPVAPTLSTISYSDVSGNFDANAPVFEVSSISAASVYTGSAPVYNSPVLTTSTEFQNFTSGLSETDPGIFNLNAVAPSKPSLSAQSITLTGTAPSYLKSIRKVQVAFQNYTSGLTETDPGAFSSTSVVPSAPTLSSSSVTISGTAPDFIAPVVDTNFSQVTTYIDTEEDIELAGVKLQQISQQLNEYQAKLQSAQAQFNKENAEYQAKLQKDIRDADFDNQEDARSLQKYQAEVSAYQATVNQDIQEYTQKMSLYQLELNTSYTAWAKTESDNLQEYQIDLTNELNNFNKENSEYQTVTQKDIQNAQLLDQHEARKLQDYQAGLSVYQADVNKEVQEYTQKLNQYQMELNMKLQAWQKAETDKLSKYQSDIQTELNNFNEDNTKYQSAIQESIQNAQLANQKNLAKAQADLSKATSDKDRDLQRQLQNAVNNMQKLIQDNTSIVSKYTTELNSYNAEISKYNADVSKYQNEYTKEIQENNAKIQQFQLLYNQLKTQYNESFIGNQPRQPQQ